ncbi:type A von Willebrand factor domain-containing protein [Heterostelium album PN500]|uniref:Type A von Willebrand factor domain-containing protein n=1 Tax=Heterostelium pallidum (strain ATCC 26659 / Pp 5 / PN500) TaxID=670386 RepID=D3BM16_HETP5|nr:type A von Willebrand factor domain-containing protein [Heterostelium album PN500]EFA77617.1 type A von Willebrand factor domain-containing protein [Heterostelium album PN500]|eukprot:XP_020429745.1 type A von Willebrand factor domain-containing protein [Heterostelium album PN500]
MEGRSLTTVCTLLLFVTLISHVSATHFRYGTLSWVQSTSNDRAWTFTLKAAFRYSYFPENSIYPKVGDTITYGVFSFDYTYRACFIFCWDETDTDQYNIKWVVNNIDLNSDWITATMIQGFSATSGIFWIKGYYYGQNRLSTLVNNADGAWNLQVIMPLKNGVTGQVSPTSSLLPVIPLNLQDPSSKIFPIPANDPSKTTLSYSLASSSVMAGSQPNGLSISSNGIVTFNPTQTGVFSAQVLVTKSYSGAGTTSYIPVDFLVNVTNTPIIATPPSFIVPTPTIGTTLQISARILSNIVLAAYTPMSGRTCEISIGDLPTGVVRQSPVVSGSYTNVTLQWLPDTSAVGTYIINLSTKDNQGVVMSGGSQYFYLQVTMPQCGNGQPVGGVCQCDPGWTGPKCDQCAPGRYGPNCIVTPPCVNGVPSEGTTGTGICTCNQGWTGPSCNQNIIQRCSLSNPSTIISQQIALASQILQPAGSQVFLSAGSLSSVNFPSYINQPNNLALDIYFVFDLTSASSIPATTFASLKTSFPTLVTNLVGVRPVIKYGVGTFSDSVASASPFTLKSYLKTGTDIMATINSLAFTTAAPLQDLPYTAVTQGIPYMTWSSANSIKSVILITDNNIAPSTAALNQLQAALTNYNVLLGVFAYGSSSTYNWLSPAKLGANLDWSASSNWFAQLPNLVSTLGSSMNIFVASDTSSVVNAAPVLTSNTATFANFTTVLKFPVAPITDNNPTVTLRSPGFGHQIINIQYNHAPVTSSFSITVNENTGVGTAPTTTFAVSASDVDFNVLSVNFAKLPTLGTLLYKGNPVTALTDISPLTPTSKDFTFNPSLYKYGSEQITFTVSDGCLQTTGTLTINVNMQNIAPTCSNVAFTADQFNSINFTLSGTEFNGLSLNLQLSSTIAQLASIGTIMYNGQPAVASTNYPSPSNFTFVPKNSAVNGPYSTSFIVTNPATLSKICTLTITVARLYLPPTISIVTSQTMTPLTTKTIPFTISSYEDILKVNITSISPASGKFYDNNNSPINSAPYQFGTYTLTGVYSASANIYYAAINANENNIAFTIQVADYFGGTDTKTVTIAVTGPRVNHPPIANAIPTQVLNEDDVSATMVLNGSDPDQPRYDNTLSVIIINSPQSGVLTNPDGSALNNFNNAPLNVIYKPNTGFYGQDQFTYALEDSLSASSNQVVVTLNVNHVNHAPTITLPSLALYGQTGGQTPTQTFTVVPSDVDAGDALTVTVLTVPTPGAFSLAASGVAVTAGTVITTFDLIYTIPVAINHDFVSSYSIKVCDNYSPQLCFTQTAPVTFNFTTIHPPPTCQPVTITTDQLTNYPFTLTGADQDSAPGTVTAQITAFPGLSTVGSLLYNGQQIQTTDQLVVPAAVTFSPLATTDNANVPLAYTIVNQFGMSVQCPLTLIVNRVGVAPTLQLSDTITITPDVNKSIPFTVSDLDFNEVLTVTVTSVTPSFGTFYDQNNVTINTVNQALGSFNVAATHTSSSFFTYKASNQQYSGVSITLLVTDSTGKTDSKTLNIVVSGSVVSYQPVANPVGPIVTDQNGQSDEYTFTASHPNMPAYNGALTVVISTPPQRGSIVNHTSLATPTKFIYVPSPNIFGTDSFQYYVVDDNGITSNIVPVAVTINKVDYPPIIDFNPPTIVATGDCLTQPSSIPFNLTVTNINEVDFYNVTLTVLPTKGFFYYKGQKIVAVPFPLPIDQLENTLTFLSNDIKFGYADTYQITSCTNIKCGNTTGNILFDYSYSTPVGATQDVVTLQDAPVAFTLGGSVCEGETVFFQFLSLPLYGVFIDSNGNNITSTTTNVTNPSVTYAPNAGIYGRPVETVYYQVLSHRGQVSISYPLNFYVDQVIFPTYNGPLNFTTYENVSLPLMFTESNVVGSMIQILSYTRKGELVYHFNETSNINITKSGLQRGGASPYKFTYYPPPGVFGQDLDSFQFVLAQNFTSKVYTVYITVLQVFVAPVVIPLTYTKEDALVTPIQNGIAQVLTNGSTVLTWNVTSEDLPWATLTSNVTTPLNRGQFFQYVDGVKGALISGTNQQVSRSSNGLWSVLYQTPLGRSGKKFATLLVYAYDEKDLSSSKTISVDVFPKNVPPVVTLNQTVQYASNKLSFAFNNVSVYDFESFGNTNNITITVNLTDSATGELATTGSIYMQYASADSCSTLTNTSITCLSTNNLLNYYLSSLTASFTKSGNYTLVVYVNDLGYIRTLNIYNSVDQLSDTKTSVIIVTAPGNGGGNKTVVISAAIAAAAVAAAIIALGVWRVLKARAPPTDAFFGDSPFSDGSVSSNPLYEHSPNSGNNPLYEGGVN